MDNGTAFIGIKARLTCLDDDCRGTMEGGDGTCLAVGIFMTGRLTNIRCLYCRGAIKEAPVLLKESDLEFTFR